MSRTNLSLSSGLWCGVACAAVVLSCGSDKDDPAPATSAAVDSQASPATPAGAAADGARPGEAPAPAPASGTVPSNTGGPPEAVAGNTPLQMNPEMSPVPDAPGGELKPPDQLTIEEFPIPENLPGCGPPYPHDPAVDEATGLVYYAGSNESCIGQFNPETGEFKAWPTATPDSYPHGLVVVDGRVYFTGIDQDLIGSVDPATGQAVDYPVDAVGPHTPVVHDGAVWFTAQRGGQFGRLDLMTGEAEVAPLSASNTQPYGIWPAPDGSLWMALFGTNRLARIDTAADPLSAEEFVLPQPSSRPRRIAVDAQGKVWFTDYPRRALGRLDPSLPEGMQVSEFPTPGGGRPYGIAVGPDGRIWYNDQDAGEIVGFDQTSESVVARLSLELDNPGPVRNIAVDQPRRRLWLAISNVGRLAVIQF